MVVFALCCLGLLLAQGSAVLILLSRLLKGARRRAPLKPQPRGDIKPASVSVVVPTLNEVQRLDPCLAGLAAQGQGVREILVVDSRSQDGTREKVLLWRQKEPRLDLLTDDPLPAGWVGRPWALNYGFERSSPESEWILNLDADTQPQPGLVEAIVGAAQTENYDFLSLSPRFILRGWGEWLLQPALLLTLLYRFDSAGVRSKNPQRVMANGQCFLARRAALAQLGGYQSARQSFCDDVTLARFAAQRGFRVGFLDGAEVLWVRMYVGVQELWREWGRSLDLKDATTPAQLWGDLLFLLLTQGLPLPILLIFGGAWLQGVDFLTLRILLALNLFLLLIRGLLLIAVAPSYRWRQSSGAWAFWLSPLADPLAVLRIWLSAQQTPRSWRGRVYNSQSLTPNP